MGLSLEYKCSCNADLTLDKDSARPNFYICPDCDKTYERRRNDVKWVMRPVKPKKKNSGVTAPRPYYYGLLWE